MKFCVVLGYFLWFYGPNEIFSLAHCQKFGIQIKFLISNLAEAYILKRFLGGFGDPSGIYLNDLMKSGTGGACFCVVYFEK